MYYKRQLPVFSGVYRPLEVRRYMVMTMGGYWPVVQRLPNGHLGVVTRDGDFHVGERGRLVFVTSPDDGESWSHATVISADGPDNRNPAFGVTPGGTLLAAYVKMDLYPDGQYDKTDWTSREMPIYISRSTDNGATWSPGEAMDGLGKEEWSGATAGPPHVVAHPFGRMITLEDGTVLMSYRMWSRPDESGAVPYAAFVIRSRDSGRTWVDPVTVGEGFSETSLCEVGDGRVVAVLRGRDRHKAPLRPRRLWQSDSEDGGYTWSDPRPLTGDNEYPGDVIKLEGGRMLLTYGRREPPYGVQGMVSHDGGRTWDADHKLLLVGDADIDCGYPSMVLREDGGVVIVYYSHRMPSEPRLGPHGVALVIRPEDLP